MIRRGEIYMVSFDPARGHEQRGTRPALVVQNDEGNEFASTTIVASMTTSPVAEYQVRVVVSPSQSGLRERSTVLLDQLLTVDLGRVGKRLGRVTPSAMEEVDRALSRSLGLPRIWD